jgi:hypothetical protein
MNGTRRARAPVSQGMRTVHRSANLFRLQTRAAHASIKQSPIASVATGRATLARASRRPGLCAVRAAPETEPSDCRILRVHYMRPDGLFQVRVACDKSLVTRCLTIACECELYRLLTAVHRPVPCHCSYSAQRTLAPPHPA